MSLNWTDDILQQWKSEAISLNPPSSINDIEETEKNIEFNFPKQFKELYLLVDGFKASDWRTNMFSIWPISRIIEEYKLNENKNFIGFADYLINSHQIGFFKDKDGIYKDYDGSNPIAETFEECIKLINSDATLIY